MTRAGSAKQKVTRNKQMAAYMKAKGITRTQCRCPICHSVVSLASIYGHIAYRCGKKS